MACVWCRGRWSQILIGKSPVRCVVLAGQIVGVGLRPPKSPNVIICCPGQPKARTQLSRYGSSEVNRVNIPSIRGIQWLVANIYIYICWFVFPEYSCMTRILLYFMWELNTLIQKKKYLYLRFGKNIYVPTKRSICRPTQHPSIICIVFEDILLSFFYIQFRPFIWTSFRFMAAFDFFFEALFFRCVYF